MDAAWMLAGCCMTAWRDAAQMRRFQRNVVLHEHVVSLGRLKVGLQCGLDSGDLGGNRSRGVRAGCTDGMTQGWKNHRSRKTGTIIIR